MSVIAVKGIPLNWTLVTVVKVLTKVINGPFEALNFTHGKRAGRLKVCYLRLSERLDPVRVVEKINNAVHLSKTFRPFAYIPDRVPDIPLPKKKNPRQVPEDDLAKVLTVTNTEIMIELQSKYPGLYNLSKKTSHHFLNELGKVTYKRLNVIAQQNPEVCGSYFKMSQCYRRVHPHFGDFQLVLNTLHAIEDAAGKPRTQLQEKQLTTLPPNPHIYDNVPYAKIQEACKKYSERIIKKVTEHIKGLKSEITDTDSEDEIAKKKVRKELKKLSFFLPLIMRQVITTHFIPKKSAYYRIRIYGEPFLPSRETTFPFVNRYNPQNVTRSTRMYNLLCFNVPPAHYASLMAMDGTVLNGAKLVIRPADLPQHMVPIYSVTEDVEDAVEAMDDEELWIQLQGCEM